VRKDVKQCLRRIAWLDTQRNKCFEFITKRFDVKEDGSKCGKEDFATLAGKTKDIILI
jgi:serine/threonine protein kinase HipA of HipAB toxin-antitoxin module